MQESGAGHHHTDFCAPPPPAPPSPVLPGVVLLLGMIGLLTFVAFKTLMIGLAAYRRETAATSGTASAGSSYEGARAAGDDGLRRPLLTGEAPGGEPDGGALLPPVPETPEVRAPVAYKGAPVT